MGCEMSPMLVQQQELMFRSSSANNAGIQESPDCAKNCGETNTGREREREKKPYKKQNKPRPYSFPMMCQRKPFFGKQNCRKSFSFFFLFTF